MITPEDLDWDVDSEARIRYRIGEGLAKLWFCLKEAFGYEPGNPTVNAEVCCRIGFENYLSKIRVGGVSMKDVKLKDVMKELRQLATGIDDDLVQFINDFENQGETV